MLSLICPWHYSQRGTETSSASLSCHLKIQMYLKWSVQGTTAAQLRKCERLQIVRGQKALAWKAVAQPHLPMAVLAQRHRDWGCFLVLPPQNSNVAKVVRAEGYCGAAPKMRTSADSSQPEKAGLQSCCSASSAHGTARTEAQRLGLLACLAPPNFTCILGGPCWAPPSALP